MGATIRVDSCGADGSGSEYADPAESVRPHLKQMGLQWCCFPMELTIDSSGRILLPKSLRESLGLLPGTKVDVSPYGGGVQLTPGGRTARVERGEDGHLVATSQTPVTDDVMFALIDGGRR
ncbi:AbrB/MazE/SpoVT family DNA-binding domain-containing protein [Actinomyces ruminicola]|uniref:Looped-hinge helix DNA binding domain-containing protein, AbrB family n=1 Tax=Actinomyces ruminicola TaxID=332524 RepID=A0A1G9WSW4_9ACTO|nr:AbrB/MazE/SpoVT family DNA-binding domain-containing protein [Actinomyces ruminicola]SDM87321.1 looped-hinge helix DNA binding domain-containing protein, AbrB family [Actinomyces ruminicola]